MKILQTVLMSAAITTSSAGFAADKKSNPFGLVYNGAITENVKGQVNIHHVSYKLNGLDIVANVYTPANYDPNKKYPAVVVTHPNGGVKEQVVGFMLSVWLNRDISRLPPMLPIRGAVVDSHAVLINLQTELKMCMVWLILLPNMQGWTTTV